MPALEVNHGKPPKFMGAGVQRMIEPLAVPIPEAARLGGVGRSTIYAEIKSKKLKIRKVGRRTIVAMDDLRAWLASKIGEAA
ncbi:MAG: helix-turn-helix domain-containing protein [Aestuariivirga sp.]